MTSFADKANRIQNKYSKRPDDVYAQEAYNLEMRKLKQQHEAAKEAEAIKANEQLLNAVLDLQKLGYDPFQGATNINDLYGAPTSQIQTPDQAVENAGAIDENIAADMQMNQLYEAQPQTNADLEAQEVDQVAAKGGRRCRYNLGGMLGGQGGQGQGGGGLLSSVRDKIHGMLPFAQGGTPPQQQGGPDQMMQDIAQALQQGAPPEEVMKELVQMGMPEEQAQQIIGAVMQQLQQGQQQGPSPEEMAMMQQQQQQQMAAYGGAKTPYGLGAVNRPQFDKGGRLKKAETKLTEYQTANPKATIDNDRKLLRLQNRVDFLKKPTQLPPTQGGGGGIGNLMGMLKGMGNKVFGGGNDLLGYDEWVISNNGELPEGIQNQDDWTAAQEAKDPNYVYDQAEYDAYLKGQYGVYEQDIATQNKLAQNKKRTAAGAAAQSAGDLLGMKYAMEDPKKYTPYLLDSSMRAYPTSELDAVRKNKADAMGNMRYISRQNTSKPSYVAGIGNIMGQAGRLEADILSDFNEKKRQEDMWLDKFNQGERKSSDYLNRMARDKQKMAQVTHLGNLGATASGAMKDIGADEMQYNTILDLMKTGDYEAYLDKDGTTKIRKIT